MTSHLRRFRDRAKPLEVVLDRLWDPWILDFDGDEITRLRHRTMDLAERRRRERLGIELPERLLRLDAHAAHELRAHQRRMHAGRFALELRELGNRLVRQHTAVETERLPQLHRRTAQRPEVVAHAARGAAVRGLELGVAGLLVEEDTLDEIPQVAAGDAGTHAGHLQGAPRRRVSRRRHQTVRLTTATPIFRVRSRKASVFCLRGDSSWSQNRSAPR